MSIDKYSCEFRYDNPEKYCKNCESETCIDGRQIEAVNEYASTCDGCGELIHHDLLTMDEETQLGYCKECMKNET